MTRARARHAQGLAAKPRLRKPSSEPAHDPDPGAVDPDAARHRRGRPLDAAGRQQEKRPEPESEPHPSTAFHRATCSRTREGAVPP